MPDRRHAGPGLSDIDCDFVAAALHALADLIESCEVDRQLIEFDPDELRGHAAVLERLDRSGGVARPRLQGALASTVERVGPIAAADHVTGHDTDAAPGSSPATNDPVPRRRG